MDILSVGEIVIDFLPGGPGVYIRKPGGAPANVAVAMSRLGPRRRLLRLCRR